MNASKQVDAYVFGISDWRGDVLTRLRVIIHDADPDIVEEWKWDVPVFTHNGMVCAISAFKSHVKINFFKGARLKDPNSLINSGLESKSHRSINFQEGDIIKEKEIKGLIREAIALNTT